MRYFLDISYKGTSFHGWQRQPNAYTVQEALEKAMNILLQEEIQVTASGRTDTGVHARQQMIHFDTEQVLNEDFVYKINHILPESIVASHLYRVSEEAHARFDAISRSYEYHIHVTKDPFVNQQSYRVKPKLDLVRLNTAAALLVGKQDFCSFSKVHTAVTHFECDIKEARWEQHGNKIIFYVTANRFLRGMVRTLVGTMLEIGIGKQEVFWIKEILEAKDRKAAGRAVDPEGLFLTQVVYPVSVLGTQFYKDKAVLKDVSFTVSNGEVLGIVGPNGAGKSTLLRIVSGILDADGGEVQIDGKALSITSSNAWGYLPEERGLYPQMLVLDQLIHFGGLKGLTNAEAKSKAMHLMQQLKMEQYSASKAGDLSKGNQQRIQFLTAIIHDPALIILDEPFSGLDPIQTDWLKEQIQLFRKQGKKIIYSSHQMESVEALCDRILVLHDGARKAYGTAAELCRQPAGLWQVSLTGGDASWQSMVEILSTKVNDNGQSKIRFALGNAALPAVIAAIDKSGAALESIKRYKRSLHEVFVQLTQDTHEE